MGKFSLYLLACMHACMCVCVCVCVCGAAIENDEDMRVLESEIVELTRQNAVEESRLETLRRDIATMEEKLAQQDDDLASLEAASNAANSSLADLRAVLGARLRSAGLMDPAASAAAGGGGDVGEVSADAVDAFIAEHLAACQRQNEQTSSAVRAAVREALAGVTLRR